MDKSVDNKKPNNVRKRLNKILDIVFAIFGVVALAVAGVLFYQRVYLSHFWVNGQSMYPTLNANALKPDGTPIGQSGGSVYDGTTMIDYGVMDTHDAAIKKIKRFDIVVTHYPDRPTNDSMIKRVIGLPGETIKFTFSPSKETNGDLYVKSGDNFTYVAQDFITNEAKYKASYPAYEIELKDNEYYLVGDNRSNSHDSRAVGPITRDLLVGKVIAICGTCEIENNEPKNIKYHWPRFM